MKRIRIIAIISAVITAFAFYLYLASMKKPETITRVPVVVALQEIAEGQEITSGMVAIKEMPQEAVVSMAAARLDMVVGYISSDNVKPEEQMLVSKVFKAGETSSGLSFALEKGMRAFTISVDPVSGVAGFINPKDAVDVLLVIGVQEESPTSPNTQVTKTYSMILLQNIRVLATGKLMKPVDKNAAPEAVETITLSVTPDQAVRLNFAASEGKIRLVLRSPKDSVIALSDEPDILDLTGNGITAKPEATANPDGTAKPDGTAVPAPTATPAATAKPKK